MRRSISTLAFVLIACASFSQSYLQIDFEDTATVHQQVALDTISFPNNDWRIGVPDKLVFNAAHSGTQVIATKLTGTYTDGDTSSFIVKHLASQGWDLQYPKVDIGGYYWVDSDSLTDFGYIDFSLDLGGSWTRVDSVLGYCSWGAEEELPVFTGSSVGWKHFYYCIDPPQAVPDGDTVFYRFNFVSDTISSDKDGLMFDDLHFEDWAEGIDEVGRGNVITVWPNPLKDDLLVRSTKMNEIQKVRIFDPMGRTVLEDLNFNGDLIDVSGLNNGVFLLECSGTTYRAVQKIVVQH